METRVALEDYSKCGTISVADCINDCAEPNCRVRELRTVIAGTSVEVLVEKALEEHWYTAYNVGLNEFNIM